MTIINNRKFTEPRFENLSPGNVFYWKGFYFIKLTDSIDVDGVLNAVCLTDGVPENFNDDEPVFPVDATLTIS